MATPTATPTITAVTNGASDGGTNLPHIKSYTYVANTVAPNHQCGGGRVDGDKVLVAYVLSGANTTTPIDVAGNNSTTGPTSHVLSAISPTTANAFHNSPGSTTQDPPGLSRSEDPSTPPQRHGIWWIRPRTWQAQPAAALDPFYKRSPSSVHLLTGLLQDR